MIVPAVSPSTAIAMDQNDSLYSRPHGEGGRLSLDCVSLPISSHLTAAPRTTVAVLHVIAVSALTEHAIPVATRTASGRANRAPDKEAR